MQPVVSCHFKLTSAHTQAFLLFQTAEVAEWAQHISESRDYYSRQRDHFLKFIKHPEELAKVAVDPLTDDPKVSIPALLLSYADMLTSPPSPLGTPSGRTRLFEQKSRRTSVASQTSHFITKNEFKR